MKYFFYILIFLVGLNGGALDFKSLQSDFVQTITNDQNSTISYEGVFYATDKNKALWIYNKPVKKSIYFNDKEVVIIEPSLEQVIVTTLQNSPNLAQIIKDAKKMKKDFYKAAYEDMEYFVTIKDGKISSIWYRDKLDNKVVIEFKNLEKNTILSDALFRAKVPDGYDVVNQ